MSATKKTIQERIKNGLCARCREFAVGGKKSCQFHLEKATLRGKLKREKRKQQSLCLACGRSPILCRCKDRARKRRQYRLSNNICVSCGKNNAINNLTRCLDCKNKHNKLKIRFCKICFKEKVSNKKQICLSCRYDISDKKGLLLSIRGIKIDKETIKKRNLTDILCNRCHKNNVNEGYKRCSDCNIKTKERYYLKDRSNVKQNKSKIKEMVFSHYGNKCNICGENDIIFLTIDHLFGNGRRHRKSIGKNSSAFYYWIIKNNFPHEFQILCYNCNIKKYREELKLKSKCIAKYSISKRNELIKFKNMILNHYGKYCACCGIRDYDVLCIDHINNGGNKHRKSIRKQGIEFYRWIINNKYPSFLRIMCYSCNNGRRLNNSVCPHQQSNNKILESEKQNDATTGIISIGPLT